MNEGDQNKVKKKERGRNEWGEIKTKIEIGIRVVRSK